MGKKKPKLSDDPELQKLEKRSVETIPACNAAVHEAYELNAQLNQHKAAAAKLEAKITILADKVIAFATVREVPLVGNAWALDYGQVVFSEPGSRIAFDDGVTMEDVVAGLRALKAQLKEKGVDVVKIIERKESVKFDDLRAIPGQFRRKLGFTIEPTPGKAKLVFAESDTRKKPPTRRKPS